MHKALRLFLSFFIIIISFLLPLHVCQAAGEQCSYLLEDFSGSSGISWTPAFGTWNITEEQVEIQVATDVMSNYASAFSPSDLFVVDVDVKWMAGTHIDTAYGIFPYTSGLTLFQADGRDVSGIGVIVYPNRGNARLLAWDVPGQMWYQSETLELTGPITSIGIAYLENKVILRLNGENTSLSFLGDFSYAPGTIDTLWLLAQFEGTQVRFDNVCAGPEVEVTSQHTLTVIKNGTGSGTVTSSTEGINCGSDCTETYNEGTLVTLSALPETGSIFSGWSGGGCSGTGSCSVTMNANSSVTASFTAEQSADLMPIPTGQEIFSYAPVNTPVKSLIPSEARPIGVGAVADGNDTFDISVGMEESAGPVGIYLGLFLPAIDPVNLYLVKPDGAFANASVEGLVPWKDNFTGKIDETLFTDIPLSLIPPGTYYFYLLVTPPESIDTYYLWATYFTRPGAYLQANPDPLDPIIGVLSGVDTNETMLIFGPKDEDGSPTGIDVIHYYKNGTDSGEKPYTYYFDKHSLLSKITGPDGQVATFSYDGQTMLVTLKDLDGSVSIEPFSFDSSEFKRNMDKVSRERYAGGEQRSVNQMRSATTIETVTGNLKVELVVNGVAAGNVEDAHIEVDVDGFEYPIPAPFDKNTGQYVFVIPHRILDLKSVVSECEVLNGSLSQLFTEYGPPLTVLGLACAAYSGPTAPVAFPVCAFVATSGIGATMLSWLAQRASMVCRDYILEATNAIKSGEGDQAVLISGTHPTLDFSYSEFVNYDLFNPQDPIATSKTFTRSTKIEVDALIKKVELFPNPPEPCQTYQIGFQVAPPGTTIKYRLLGDNGSYDISETLTGSKETENLISSPIYAGRAGMRDSIEPVLLINDIEVARGPVYRISYAADTKLQPVSESPRLGCNKSAFPLYFEGKGTHTAIDDRLKYKENREKNGYQMPGEWYAECTQQSEFQVAILEDGYMELKICDCLSAFVDPTDGSSHCYNHENVDEDECSWDTVTRSGTHKSKKGEFQIFNPCANPDECIVSISGTYTNDNAAGEGLVETYAGFKEIVDRDIYEFTIPEVESLSACYPGQ